MLLGSGGSGSGQETASEGDRAIGVRRRAIRRSGRSHPSGEVVRSLKSHRKKWDKVVLLSFSQIGGGRILRTSGTRLG